MDVVKIIAKETMNDAVKTFMNIHYLQMMILLIPMFWGMVGGNAKDCLVIMGLSPLFQLQMWKF